jgi:hypothetical protein
MAYLAASPLQVRDIPIGTQFLWEDPMRTLLFATLTALLANAGVSQAAFAPALPGQQLVTRTRRRARLNGQHAVTLQSHSPESLRIRLEETAAVMSMTEAKADTSGTIETSLPVLAGQVLH